MSGESSVPIRFLTGLHPIGMLSIERLTELSRLGYIERVGRDLDPFRVDRLVGRTVYLLSGKLALTDSQGKSVILDGGSEQARLPIGRGSVVAEARALTELELIRFDDELIDIMITWDQLAAVETARSEPGVPAAAGAAPAVASDWRLVTGFFGVNNLRDGGLGGMSAPEVAALIARFERVEVKRGQAVVSEGGEGDFYYVLESGRAEITRRLGGADVTLAQIKAGDAFGEEALLSGGRRNATITMTSDGALLRLSRADFDAFLRRPLLRLVSCSQAEQQVALGGLWIDVRYPSEYRLDKIDGALNVPLAEIRHAAGILDREREYVLYCDTGRRSAAAAFLLAQRGYRTFALAGGLVSRYP